MKRTKEVILATECSAETAAAATLEVNALKRVAEYALETWGDGNPEGRTQCESDLVALTRVAEILEIHTSAQRWIDHLLGGPDRGATLASDDTVT